nr:unnamed protein product [Callosobruchus chinensis]
MADVVRKKKRSRSSGRVDGEDVKTMLESVMRRLNAIEHRQKCYRHRPVHSSDYSGSDQASNSDDVVSDDFVSGGMIQKLSLVVTANSLPEAVNITSILGEDEIPEKCFSGPILEELVPRYEKVLLGGMKEETRVELIRKYLPPEDMKAIVPPKINPEVKVAIQANAIQRDNRLSKIQEQLAAVISALVQFTSDLAKKGGEENLGYIATSNDALRLLCDVFHHESVSRRELLLLNVNRDLKETLKNTAISELLFGTEQLPQKDEESSSSSSLSSQKQQQEKTPILGVSRLCGRLSLFSQRWKDLGFHRQVISSPVQRIAPIEPKRSQKESDAIDSSIENLPHEGILSLVSPCKGQFISNVFIVPRSDGSSRLVLNLKSFNEFVKTSHFKLGTHKTVSQVITPNCYMSNIDFKDAYYLVPIYNAHKKYLRFCFNGSTYEYNCFPFGLSCAPQIFTKILKPVVSHLRKRNLLSVIYLDDFLLLGVTLEECALNTRETIRGPPSVVEKSYPGNREVVREALLQGRVPLVAMDICLASITDSTFKQYSGGLRLWWTFCVGKDIDPYKVTVENVLEFLTFHFHRALPMTTKSQIREYLDPQIVLTLVKTLKTESLPLKTFSKKLAVLLALATGQRLQTISLIRVSNISIQSQRILIRISDRIKTSSINRSQPTINLPFFVDEPEVCVASTLVRYLNVTKGLRDSSDWLFITFKKPHRKASTSTISRWIKDILEWSGLDMSIFKPQSTRHASTSYAARAGVSFETILLAAG